MERRATAASVSAAGVGSEVVKNIEKKEEIKKP